MSRTIADLQKGEQAVISGFTDSTLSLRFLEMGCLPGTAITLSFIAPLGDPLGVKMTCGCCIWMRRDEAATVLITEA
jgi:ferrous iron transport protein A